MQLMVKAPLSRRQRGLSMVELMVGITIGLIVVAGASLMMVNQVTEHTRLMRETQLQQDLRAVADLIQRDLRRAGFWAAPESGVWAPGASPATGNFYAPISQPNTHGVLYSYSQSDQYITDPTSVLTPEVTSLPANANFGFRLSADQTTIQSLVGGVWQPLTDPQTVTIDDFTISTGRAQPDIDLSGFCASACSGTSCPTQKVRLFDVNLKAHSTQDPTVVRTLKFTTRVRNDQVVGACP